MLGFFIARSVLRSYIIVMNTRPVSFTLPPDLIARLDAVAESEDRSRSAVVRRTLERALAEHAAAMAEAERRFRELQGVAPRPGHAEESERP